MRTTSPGNRPLCFALFFGNRGFFPGSLIEQARQTLKAVVEKAGYQTLMLDAYARRFGDPPRRG